MKHQWSTKFQDGVEMRRCKLCRCIQEKKVQRGHDEDIGPVHITGYYWRPLVGRCPGKPMTNAQAARKGILKLRPVGAIEAAASAHAKIEAERLAICRDAPLFEDRLRRAGMLATALAMNKVVKAAGYEVAELRQYGTAGYKRLPVKRK
jgi:hypothetical protein